MSEFTKDMLKTGMRVKTRSGECYLVIQNYETELYGFQKYVLFNLNSPSFMRIDSHENDLIYMYDHGFDIVEVAKPESDGRFLDENSWITIWKREEPKPKIRISKSNMKYPRSIGWKS